MGLEGVFLLHELVFQRAHENSTCNTNRLMRRLIIHMHKRPLHIRQLLQLDLQRLGTVMALGKAEIPVHNDVHLSHQAGARVVGAHGVDLEDEVRMRHCCCTTSQHSVLVFLVFCNTYQHKSYAAAS